MNRNQYILDRWIYIPTVVILYVPQLKNGGICPTENGRGIKINAILHISIGKGTVLQKTKKQYVQTWLVSGLTYIYHSKTYVIQMGSRFKVSYEKLDRQGIKYLTLLDHTQQAHNVVSVSWVEPTLIYSMSWHWFSYDSQLFAQLEV